MHQKSLVPFALLMLVAISAALADDAPPKGDVTITAKADREQPTGWPLVVEVTLTNSGASAITWWCGGPDVYPGAEHFVVEARYGADTEWHAVEATNGQYVEGSGFNRALKPGESIVVPLAIPVNQADGISFRITPREWRATAAAEGYVQLRGEPQYADARRARVIEAAMAQSPAFWQHLAQRYADDVVIDTMLKLVTVDNAPIASGAARVLAGQKTFPASAGDSFAALINRWLPREPRPEWGGLREWIAEAALKTQSEQARAAMLKLMTDTTDARTRWIAINGLRLSPGDKAWLGRAREAILALHPVDSDDDFAREQKLASEWLDSRIKVPQ